MLDSLTIVDFDLDVSEVLLVHRNKFVQQFKWSEYLTGRGFDGLSFCLSGRAAFDFADSHFGLSYSRFELSRGQMVFLPAGSSYTVRCDSDEPFVHYTANFRLDRSDADSSEPTAVSEILSGRLRHITSENNAAIYQNQLDELLSVWLGKHSGYRVLAKSIIYRLLYLYFTDADRTHRNRDEYNKLLPAKRLLDQSYTENRSVSELATLCDMSETHFRRLFTKLFGRSPTEYRLEKRMLRARDLLLSGQYSVAETAREVGYSDPNYFTRLFRARIGVSPSDFMIG